MTAQHSAIGRNISREVSSQNALAVGRGMLVAFALMVAQVGFVAADEAGDEPKSGQTFNEQSVALRTALHYDPTLESPLERLVALYRGAGKLQELVTLYRTHVSQYPNDPSGRTVFVRLLVATGDPSALKTAEAAVQQFPKSAILHHILYQQYKQRNDKRAIDELDKAIEAELRPTRKLKWVEALLPLAQLGERRELAIKHLKAISAIPRNADQRLEIGRLMNRFKYFDLAFDLLTKKGDSPGPETMVDLELETATAEVGLKKADDAGKRLEVLLGRLTGDYWRRPDIVRRRLALVSSPEARDELISAAKKRVEDSPRSEAAVLDLAQTLAGLQFRREALNALVKGSKDIPNSEVIEQRTLELFDRLRDERGREAYLADRIKLHPKRPDLVLLQVKSKYILGERKEADQKFEALIKSMTPKQKSEQILEMARFLRRSSLTTECADLLEQVVKLNPNRLDVRRELAEVRLALGQRHKVSEAFENAVPAEAAIEEVLDLVQFMTQQKLFIESAALIRERLKVNKTNLELRLLLVNIERRMGRLAGGSQMILESRELADTGARYRAWLEAATEFFDEFDALDGFMAAEVKRVNDEQGEWTQRQVERRLAFAEVASSSGYEVEAAAMLRRDLEADLKPLMKLAVRRVLIDILKDDRNQFAVVEEELNSLAKEDPQAISEYSARLAMLHKGMNREDKAIQFLQKVDPTQIREATLLSGLLSSFQNRTDYADLMLRIRERLTVINPGDRANWESWLTVLATRGDDERLRVELRRLLAGVKEMTLDESTRNTLQLYVADSYWRSISRKLTEASGAQLAEVLPLLDSIERMARDDQQWLWMSWIRAHVLNQVGNEKARDEAIAELERVVKSLTVILPDGQAAPGVEPRIVFPDGVSVSIDQARKLLSEGANQRLKFAPMADASPIMPKLKTRWSWTSGGAGVSALVPLGDRILIGEYSGAVSCVAAQGGKIAWTRDGILPSFQVDANQRQYMNASMIVSQLGRAGYKITPITNSEGEVDRFCVGGLSHISCYELKTGKTLWKADVGASVRNPGRDRPKSNMNTAAVSIFITEGDSRLLTWDPAQSTMARVDPQTGKVMWYRVVEKTGTGYSNALNSGATLYGDYLLVYGGMTAVIDIRDGKTIWSFDPHQLRSFPINLDEKKKKGPQLNRTPAQPQFVAISSVQPQPYVWGTQAAQQIQNPFIHTHSHSHYSPAWSFNQQQPVTLTSTAVMWAGNTQRGTAAFAQLVGSQLMLYQNSQVHIIDLNLPLTTNSVPINGFMFGQAGRVICSVGHNAQVTFTDLKSKQSKTHDSSALLPPQGTVMKVPVMATTDGMLAYVTGEKGIQCINTRSGELIYQTEWPARATPKKVKATLAATPPTPPNPFGSSLRVSSYSYGGYNPAQYRHPIVNCSLACVHDGVLYTLTAENTVVALEGAGLDGR